jgi:hypothetical protein
MSLDKVFEETFNRFKIDTLQKVKESAPVKSGNLRDSIAVTGRYPNATITISAPYSEEVNKGVGEDKKFTGEYIVNRKAYQRRTKSGKMSHVPASSYTLRDKRPVQVSKGVFRTLSEVKGSEGSGFIDKHVEDAGERYGKILKEELAKYYRVN